MAKKSKTRKTKLRNDDPVLDTLQTLLIVQLHQAGAGGHQIRRVARVGMARVTSITRYLPKKGQK